MMAYFNRRKSRRKKTNNETPEQTFRRIRMPNTQEKEMFAVITKLLGTNKVQAMCKDGKERVCRIPGRMKKRIWLREGDLITVKLWDFQTDKADVVWRYSNTEKFYLARKGALEGLSI